MPIFLPMKSFYKSIKKNLLKMLEVMAQSEEFGEILRLILSGGSHVTFLVFEILYRTLKRRNELAMKIRFKWKVVVQMDELQGLKIQNSDVIWSDFKFLPIFKL